MFTREHYVEVARLLKGSMDTNFYSEKALFFKIVRDFVELFKESSKFDTKKFLDAIYGEEVKDEGKNEGIHK